MFVSSPKTCSCSSCCSCSRRQKRSPEPKGANGRGAYTAATAPPFRRWQEEPAKFAVSRLHHPRHLRFPAGSFQGHAKPRSTPTRFPRLSPTPQALHQQALALRWPPTGPRRWHPSLASAFRGRTCLGLPAAPALVSPSTNRPAEPARRSKEDDTTGSAQAAGLSRQGSEPPWRKMKPGRRVS